MTDWILIAGGVSITLAVIFFACALHAGACLIKCEQQKGSDG